MEAPAPRSTHEPAPLHAGDLPRLRLVGQPSVSPVESVGVVGAGQMGQAIAVANLCRGIPVTLFDAAPQTLRTAASKIRDETGAVEVAAPGERQAGAAPPLTIATSLADLAAADLVIESVVEDAAVKRQLLAEIEPHLGERALLASNTSTIPIARFVDRLARPERCCGLHFFHPVPERPLVEVVRGPRTGDDAIEGAVGYARQLGKLPIVVGDGPGFLVNRLLLPMMNEAVELLLDGATTDGIERVARDFGFAYGPLTMFDMIGIDVSLHAGRTMYGAFPDRVVASEMIVALYKRGRLGEKAGRGFFRYGHGERAGRPDREVAALIEERRRARQTFTPEQIVLRLLLPMLLEATRVLEEGLVDGPQTVDAGLVHGIGFPAAHEGLLAWADRQGAGQILEWLEPLRPLGKRYDPTPLLSEMARTGATFY